MTRAVFSQFAPRIPILAVLLLLFALTAFARADSLRADFAPLTLRPRTNAPAIFDLTLHRAGAGLLEGALEITLESGGDVLLRQRTQDLALPAGAQSFRIITPPLPPTHFNFGTDAHLRFVTKKDAIDLGIFPVAATSRAARNFVLAVCDTHAAGARDMALWQSLRLESFLPSGANTSNLIATAPAFLAPEDFPANPLAFFAFDAVLLDGDGFALLREKQLTALTRWVEAGGSLCVLPGRGLKDEHVRFLNAFASAKAPAPFQITDTGEFVPISEPRMRRAGLGHVVVSSRPAAETLVGDDWQRVAAFLWKIRGASSPDFFSGSRWSLPMDAGVSAKDSNAVRAALERYLQTLLPQNTHLISPRLIVLILAGFLIVVGPLDWFALGVVRRRRWTWIIFPLASAGFTALVIDAAGRALGHEDHRSALVITDVGPGGRVLRENRFELFFTARNVVSESEIRSAFAVLTTLGARDSGTRIAAMNSEPVLFSGQIPMRFTMRQQLRQWTPQFTRVTSLEPAQGTPPSLPWAEIDEALAGGKIPGLRLGEIARQHPEFGFLFFHGNSTTSLNDQRTFRGTDPYALCQGSAGGKLISRTSPTAGGEFSDLLLLDSGYKDESLLVISQRTPDGVHLYRRLFRTDD